jgi:hypothetical protein
MGSGCEYEQEGFCIFEDTEGFDAKCPLKDKIGHCTAKPDDLEEYCEDCGVPISECQCGVCWTLCKTTEGEIVPVKSGVYHSWLRNKTSKGDEK